MSTSENAPAPGAPADGAKPQEGYWLPEIVHLHLTALEAGWLTAALHSHEARDFEVNVRGPNGECVPSTMVRAITEKLNKAWENHD